MKRTIVLLLLISLFLPYSTALAQVGPESEEDLTEMSQMARILVDPITPQVFSKVKLSIDDKSSFNIKDANITWMVNGIIKNQGIGLVDFEFEIDTFDPVKIKSIINYSPGNTFTAEKEITVGINSETNDPNEQYVVQHVNSEIGQIQIKSNPTYPMALQRVLFSIYSKDKNLKYKEKQITWFVDGKQASPGLVGDDTFIIRLVKQTGTTTVAVDIAGYGSSKDDEIQFVARSNPRLKFNTTQATRVAYCLADATRMIDSDIKTLEREKDTILKKAQNASDNLTQDIEFLTNTITSITADVAETADHFTKLGGSLIDGFMSADFKSIGKAFKEIGKYIIDNPTEARLKYVYNKIDYYKALIRWYDSEVNRIENRITSMQAQIEYKKKRCIDIATKQPDFSPSIRRY